MLGLFAMAEDPLISPPLAHTGEQLDSVGIASIERAIWSGNWGYIVVT